MAKKYTVIVTIDGANNNDVSVIKSIKFNGKVTIDIKEIDEPKLNAPRNTVTSEAEITEGETSVYDHRYVPAWRIKKYGSIEMVDKVDAMAKVVAEEWAEEARKTGKFVVKKSEYKTKLYEEAEERVSKAEKKASEKAKKVSTKKAASKTVKKSSTTKTTKKTTAKANTKKSAPKKNISMDEELPFA